jgi:hypothetical protein
VQPVHHGACRGGVVKLALIWLALVATAHAEPRTDAGLVWQAPVSCPDVAEVRARIERRLGMPIERAVHGIEVDIAPDLAPQGDGKDHGFVARVDLRGVTVANEIRVLTSARCDELTDAVAVIIARLAAERRQAPSEQRGDRSRIVVSAPPPVAPRVWGGGVRGLGVSSIGALPKVSVGAELAVNARRHALFAELAGARWLPSRSLLQEGAPGAVDISLSMLTVRFGWGPEVLPLRAWITGELGRLSGKGIALDDAQVGSATWGGAGAGFAVAWPMTPHTRLVGLIEAVVALQRARFVLQDGAEVYRPSPATVRCGLGLAVGWR